QKKKRILRVHRKYEPDRISAINLQTAYEQVVPSQRYRIIVLELKCKTQQKVLKLAEEVVS
ncbi:MAG: hypothetical protein MUO77_16320, partial [Anaerolineales bacterium]|nr:hypothetical protein [Anaerolineales bacterium]